MKLSVEEKAIVDEAISIVKRHVNNGSVFTSPELTRKYLVLKMAHEEREHFGILFLDNQNRLIQDEYIFSGTVDACSVYPREVVKRALELNASAVIFYHNHPSQSTEPSGSDKRITRKLTDALELLDIRTLDHFIVAGDVTTSFAEKGLI